MENGMKALNTLLIIILAIVGAALIAGSVFLPGVFAAYGILLVVSIALGWFVLKILHKMDITPSAGALIGILTPLPAIIFLSGFLRVAVAMTQRYAPLAPLADRIAVNLSPPESTIVFYLLFNAGILYALIKGKSSALFWYFLMPVVFLVAWGVMLLLASQLLGDTLVG